MEPRKTLLYALARFDEDGLRDPFAVDLGCGSGRDTVELLRRGWKVLAIDGEAEAIERLLASEDLPSSALERLSTQVSRFEDAAWPDADLVNSSFALPFCPPESFPRLWQRIKSSVRLGGGRFSGQLFGDRDGWSGERELTFHTRAQVEALLGSFEVEWLEEVEEDGCTAVGEPKRWHLFHVVARRPAI
jgi:tellurite methyltransferase